MRIGLFSDVYTPNINGVVTSVDMLKRALEKQGHQVYIVTVNPEKLGYSYEDKVLRIPGIPIGIYDYRLTSIYPVKAIKIIQSWNLDIIHSQTEFGIGSFARILAKQFNIPIVHTYHTVYEEYVHYITKGYFQNSSKKIVEHLTKFFCDKTISELIVPTKKTYDLIKDKYKVKRDIYIVPTGIEVERFNPKKYKNSEIDKLKESIGLSKDDIVFLFVGRLGKEKNVSLLIQGHSNIVKENKNCKLVIIGDGPYRKNLEALTKKLKLEDSVLFLGKIPFEMIPKYYQIASLFATASTTETQGLTVIEAQAAALPVLAIRDDSFEDAIKDGVTGFFFKNKKQYVNIALELSKNKEKIDFMAKEALIWSQQFSSKMFASRILDVYKIAINKQPKPKNFLQKIRFIIKGGK